MKNSEPNGKIRIKDIAEKAGVSTGTVDRVLHNRGQVSQKTRERIMEIVRQIKYEPNILASALASKKVTSFACLIPKPVADSQYWTFPLKGIDKAMEEIKSYGINIKKYHFDQLDEKSFLEAGNTMLNDNPSGVLIAPIHFRESVSIVRNCRNANIPYVFMDSNIKEMEPLCFIGQDPFRSGYVAGKLLHFGKCNEGTVMVINPAREKDNPHLLLKRESGLRSYFNEQGGMNPDTIISVDIEDSDKEHFIEQMHKVLEQYPDLKGIYVSNSKAFKISRFLEEVKRQDIALIGHDLTEHNMKYLKKGTIDFLISQNPMLQGYNGLMALFKSIIVRQNIDKVQLMPIDIISRENLEYFDYHNYLYLTNSNTMRNSFDDLKGKVCAVTGGYGVIGMTICRGLASVGAKVAILGRHIDKANEAAIAITKEFGTEALGVYADVINKQSVIEANEKIKEKLGSVDVLVNCAGGNSPKATTKVEEMTASSLDDLDSTFFGLELEGFDHVFDLNFKGTLIPTLVMAKDMVLNGKGAILNVSSMNAYKPLTKIPAYSAAKAAINNFTEWMATHFAKVGVRVNGVAPGFFITSQNRFLVLKEDGTYSDRGQKIVNNTPMDKFGEPDDLIGASLYLCSDMSSFVTGICIPVDGGFNAFSGV